MGRGFGSAPPPDQRLRSLIFSTYGMRVVLKPLEVALSLAGASNGAQDSGLGEPGVSPCFVGEDRG